MDTNLKEWMQGSQYLLKWEYSYIKGDGSWTHLEGLQFGQLIGHILEKILDTMAKEHGISSDEIRELPKSGDPNREFQVYRLTFHPEICYDKILKFVDAVGIDLVPYNDVFQNYADTMSTVIQESFDMKYYRVELQLRSSKRTAIVRASNEYRIQQVINGTGYAAWTCASAKEISSVEEFGEATRACGNLLF